jgi:hypothetical protein
MWDSSKVNKKKFVLEGGVVGGVPYGKGRFEIETKSNTRLAKCPFCGHVKRSRGGARCPHCNKIVFY